MYKRWVIVPGLKERRNAFVGDVRQVLQDESVKNLGVGLDSLHEKIVGEKNVVWDIEVRELPSDSR